MVQKDSSHTLLFKNNMASRWNDNDDVEHSIVENFVKEIEDGLEKDRKSDNDVDI